MIYSEPSVEFYRCFHISLPIVAKHELGLLFPPRNLPIKFGTNPSTIFLVIVVTDRRTHKPTPVKTYSLAFAGRMNASVRRSTSYLAELVVPTSIASNRAGLRSAQSLSIAVPRTHSTLSDRAFSVAASRAWNNLPPHILHIRLLKELQIFSVFTRILTIMFLGVSFVLCFYSPVVAL